jgi:RecA/RadA recombinase
VQSYGGGIGIGNVILTNCVEKWVLPKAIQNQQQGSRALKCYASVRLDVRKMESLKQGMFKQAESDIMYGEGISR